MYSRGWFVAAALVGVLGTAACGSGDGNPGGGSGASGGGRLAVAASFYPLEYVTTRIAGDRAKVTGLTRPGTEPHDLELTPRDVAAVSEADLVVYLGGFQSAVDEAVGTGGGDRALDVAPAAGLDRQVEHEDGDTGPDPHFWLDPQRLTAVAGLVARRLTEADAGGGATFAANLRTLTSELTALDGRFRAGLTGCASTDLVTSHEAFGYLAARYGLTQVGISGLSPEAEPDPATLARVSDFVRTRRVRTIYYETLVSPAIARTVAGETGARTDVLDPIEGITGESRGADYLAVMASNLDSLRRGQQCP